MKVALERIAQNYLRDKQTLSVMESELQSLPPGRLTCRTVRGHCYYSIECRDAEGVRHSTAVPKEEVEQAKHVFERKKYLEESIRIFRDHMKLQEKAYPEFKELNYVLPANNFAPDPQKPYRTYKGDYVRSKSELIIANELYINQISYEYEKPLLLKGTSKPIHPDFTIYTPRENLMVLWEHCGLMNDITYRSNWDWRKQLYAESGISEWQKNLIVTYEAQGGDFSVEDIQQHIARLLRS